MPPRGRPKGSKNAVSRSHMLMVRLTEDLKGWLASKATGGKTMSGIAVQLLEEARKRDP